MCVCVCVWPLPWSGLRGGLQVALVRVTERRYVPCPLTFPRGPTTAAHVARLCRGCLCVCVCGPSPGLVSVAARRWLCLCHAAGQASPDLLAPPPGGFLTSLTTCPHGLQARVRRRTTGSDACRLGYYILAFRLLDAARCAGSFPLVRWLASARCAGSFPLVRGLLFGYCAAFF